MVCLAHLASLPRVSRDKRCEVTFQVRNLEPRALSFFVSIVDLGNALIGLSPTPLGSKASVLSTPPQEGV